MVFSPNTFAGAPHSWLATLTMPDADFEQEAGILSSVTRAFPAVTSVRVKDAIELVNRVVGQLASAVRAAAAVALIASVLVLAGALAAGNRARVHDAVVLKTLGATRGTPPGDAHIVRAERVVGRHLARRGDRGRVSTRPS